MAGRSFSELAVLHLSAASLHPSISASIPFLLKSILHLAVVVFFRHSFNLLTYSANMLSSTLFALAGLVSLSTAGYVLEDDYSGDSFFSMFDFFTVWTARATWSYRH